MWAQLTIAGTVRNMSQAASGVQLTSGGLGDCEEGMFWFTAITPLPFGLFGTPIEEETLSMLPRTPTNKHGEP